MFLVLYVLVPCLVNVVEFKVLANKLRPSIIGDIIDEDSKVVGIVLQKN